MAVSIDGIEGAVARLVHTNALPELDDDGPNTGPLTCCWRLREPQPAERFFAVYAPGPGVFGGPVMKARRRLRKALWLPLVGSFSGLKKLLIS